jgi:hypothetical protein
MIGVLCAQSRRPASVVALDGREPEPAAAPPASRAAPSEDEPAKPSTLFGEEEESTEHGVPEVPTSVTLQGSHLAANAEPPKPAAPTATKAPPPPPPAPSKQSLFRATGVSAPTAQKAAPAKPAAPQQSLSERFSAWRDRMRSSQPREGDVSTRNWIDARPSWRDELVTWARAIAAGTGEHTAPSAPQLEALVARLELRREDIPAFALLYGTHLGGEPGAAPVDVARVLGRNWDEALGCGALAASGAVLVRDSRVRLAPAVQRALDGLPPRTGVIVGSPGTINLLGPCAVVSPEGPIGIVAEACLPSAGGAILAGHAHADPKELALEARAYGAVAMLRVDGAGIERVPPGEPMILVVADDATADALGVPRLG